MKDMKTFLIKERVGVFKLTDTYDIWDPNTAAKVGEARETPEAWQKYLRLLVDKRLLPTSIGVFTGEGQGSMPHLSMVKPFGFFRSRLEVRDSGGRHLGTFVSKFFSLGGGFHVYDQQEQPIAEMSGDWKGWNFTLKDTGGRQWGSVTKKWAGIGKELFTSADNYVVDAGGAANADEVALVLASGLAMDMVFKEGKS